MLERWFQLKEHGSTLRIEVLGGVTTFAAMAYIIVVNPAILSHAGIPVEPSTVATILTAVFGCLLMGVYANRPLAVAPVHGRERLHRLRADRRHLAAAARRGLRRGRRLSRADAVPARTWLAAAISPSMKHSFAVGIGLFLAFIGMYQTGIVVNGAAGAAGQDRRLPRPSRCSWRSPASS